MKRFSLFCLFVISFSCFAQQPTIEWQYSYGGAGTEYLFDLAETNDGGYIVGGYSASDVTGNKTIPSFGGEDYWILKLDNLGAIEWQNAYGGSGSDYMNFVRQTPDNGYILGGRSNSPISGNKTVGSYGGFDYWLIKTDSLGVIEWQNNYGGIYSESLDDVVILADGYVLCGSTDSNVSGNMSDPSNGNRDFWIVKVDLSGNIIWQNAIGGSAFDEVNTICPTADNGFLIGGNSQSLVSGDKTHDLIGFNDSWIVKVDQNGNVLWDMVFGGDGGEEIVDIIKTNDNNYFLCSWTTSDSTNWMTHNNVGAQAYWGIKINENSDTIWTASVGNIYSDYATSATNTLDGGIIMAGWQNNNGRLVKLNTIGDSLWVLQLNGSDTDWIYAIETTSDGGFLVGICSQSPISGNKTVNTNGGMDFWVVKLSCSITSTDLGYSMPILDTTYGACTADTTYTPHGVDDCGNKYFGVPDTSFPITNQDTTIVLWMYENGVDTIFQEQIFILNGLDLSVSKVDATITTENIFGANYQWLDCNNGYMPVLGSVDTFFTSFVGDFAVQVDSLGCIDTSDCISITSADFYNLSGYSSLYGEIFSTATSDINSCTANSEASTYGGIPPYQFLWSNLVINEDTTHIDSVCAGIYQLTIYDNIGDSVIVPFYVTDSTNYYGWYSALGYVDTIYMDILDCSLNYNSLLDTAYVNQLTFLITDTINNVDIYEAEIIYIQNGNPIMATDSVYIQNYGSPILLYLNIFCPTKSSADVITVIESLDVNALMLEQAGKESFILYPNPTKGEFIVNSELNKDYTINIYTIEGKLVYSQKANTSVSELNVSYLNSGIYLVEMFSNEQQTMMKLIIEKE